MDLDKQTILGGLTALFLLLWAAKDAVLNYRQTRKAVQQNPMVTAISMAWDRDMQERLLQAFESMAKSQAVQAQHQTEMAAAWKIMSDTQQHDMTVRMEELLEVLKRKEEEELNAMLVSAPIRPR